MKKRNRVSRRGSRKLFKATGSKTHKFNVAAAPMRGGIRM